LISVGKTEGNIAGSVIKAEHATAAVIRSTRIFFTSISVLAGVLFIGIVMGAIYGLAPGELWPTLLFALVMMALVAGLIRWGYRKTERQWQARLPDRVAALPPPGTPVRLEAVGVAIGDQSFEWSELSVEQIELCELSSQDDRSYLIERLKLRGRAGGITLDRNLMENGALIVETAYRRLLRDTPSSGPAKT
jgi:hypothetical protein